MSDKIFLDTNVIVYCYTSTEPVKRSIALQLAQQQDIWVSTQVLQELSNTLRKKFHIPCPDIQLTLQEIHQNLEVFVNTYNVVLDATRIADRYGFSFYDCLIISSCLANGCNILYSEDMQDGQVIDGVLEIRNPFKTL